MKWLASVRSFFNGASIRAEHLDAVLSGLSDVDVDEFLTYARQTRSPLLSWEPAIAATSVPPGLPRLAANLLSRYRVSSPQTGLHVGLDRVRRLPDATWSVGTEASFHTTIVVDSREHVYEDEEGVGRDLAATSLPRYLARQVHDLGVVDLVAWSAERRENARGD